MKIIGGKRGKERDGGDGGERVKRRGLKSDGKRRDAVLELYNFRNSRLAQIPFDQSCRGLSVPYIPLVRPDDRARSRLVLESGGSEFLRAKGSQGPDKQQYEDLSSSMFSLCCERLPSTPPPVASNRHPHQFPYSAQLRDKKKTG